MALSKYLIYGILTATILLLAACSETPSPKTAPEEVLSILLDRTSITLTEGESATLHAIISPSIPSAGAARWSSSNTAVATVSQGKVTAVKEGAATISASIGNISASCNITVLAKTIDAIAIELNETVLELKIDEEFTLAAKVLPDNTTDKTVSWSSSNSNVVRVDSEGHLVAVYMGEAVITARSGKATATCQVNVINNANEGDHEGMGEEKWD